MRLRVFILGLMLVLQRPAFALEEPARLADYVLSADDFFELSLDRKIVYMKFLLNLTATVDEMQDIPPEDLSAQRKPIQRWLQIFIETAEAASRNQLEGKECFGGTWGMDSESGHLVCQAPPAADCGGNKAVCPEDITDMVPSLGKMCIPVSEIKHIRSRCLDKVAETAGVNLNGHLESRALHYAKPGEAKKYHQRATELKAGLEKLQAQMVGKVSLREYCKTATGRVKQAEDCAKLKQLNEAFTVATKTEADPYGDGLKYKQTPEVKDALDTLHSTPTATKKVSAKGSSSGKPIVADKNDIVDPSGNTPLPPSRPSHERAEGGSASKGHGSNQDCEARHHARLGSLSCVACGLADVSGAEAKRGVDNWISLLGIAAQKYHGPYNTNDRSSRSALQTRVIEMVASFSYCTDDQYRIQPGPEARAWIDGTSPPPGPPASNIFRDVGKASPDEIKFVSDYGVAPAKSQRMALAEDLFNDPDWDEGNYQQRGWRFRSKLQAARDVNAQKDPKWGASPFSKCATQVEQKLDRSKYFSACPIPTGKWPNGASGRPLYQPIISDGELSHNDQIYQAMAKACGLPPTRHMQTRQCDNACWGSFVSPSSGARVHHCSTDGIEAANQYDSWVAHSPNKGKTGEPSHSRSHYGGDHDGAVGHPGQHGSGGAGGTSGTSTSGNGNSSGAGPGASGAGKGGEASGSR